MTGGNECSPPGFPGGSGAGPSPGRALAAPDGGGPVPARRADPLSGVAVLLAPRPFLLVIDSVGFPLGRVRIGLVLAVAHQRPDQDDCEEQGPDDGDDRPVES